MIVQEKLAETRITAMRLFIMTNKAKKDLAIKELTNPVSFDNLQNPTRGGVYDPALGCYKSGDCETCGLPFACPPGFKMNTCPGHFGGIKLPLPVYSPYTFDFVLKILKTICLKCTRFAKRESECVLFVKQMEAIQLSLLDLCDKMSEIHEIFDQEYGAELQNKKLQDFTEQLDKCIQNAAETAPIDATKAYSKNIEGILQECRKDFLHLSKNLCSKCMQDIKKVTVDRQQGIIYMHKSKSDKGDNESERPILSAVEARAIFRNLWSTSSLVLQQLSSTFGFEANRRKDNEEYPTDLFFTDYILVMPPRSRPPNHMAGMVLEHSMSTHYSNIIKASNELKKLFKPDANASKAQKFDAWISLQMQVNVQVDKSMCKMLKDAPEGAKQLLERKEGLMRWNMMGKRVNYAARSVISPDPNIPCDKVGVPLDIARKLFITEPVTPRNIEDMRKAVINGAMNYPGATSITLENGSMISLFAKDDKQREALANRLLTPSTFGNIVNKFKMVKRHMKDGDMMLLNRQPTLHKPSIQAFKAKVMGGSRTLKINYSACKAFNADFDGDEMNAHLPQDLVSRSEALHIASATEQFLVPKDGKPIGGLIQDHIIGGMMMTMKGVFFTRDKYLEIVYAALCPQEEGIKLLPPSMIRPYELWSGKEVVSTILLNLIPSDKSPITMEGNTKISDMDWRSNQKMQQTRFAHLAEAASKTKVFIYNGILYSGLLDKSQIGASANGLLHYCYELYGGRMVSNLMSCFAKLFTNFLQFQTAFSMGMDDVEFTNEGAKKRKKCIKKIQKLGNGVMAKALEHEAEDEDGLKALYRKAIFSNDKTDVRILDASFQAIMNDYQEEIKKSCWPHQLLRTFPHNGLLASVISGAKGSSVNCLQISCLLGQVDLEGSRPAAMASGKTFALFKPFDLSPRAGGFIFGSFCTGLKQPEFFFHCMAGRDGLIDTAVKTSRSGYLQRCLVKLLEGVKVGYDGSIRDHDGSIIQTRYGCDGLDMMKTSLLSKKHFTHLLVNREAIINQSQIDEIRMKINKTNAEVLFRELDEWKERNGGGNQKALYDIFVEKYRDEAWSKIEHLDLPMWKKKSLCSKELSEMFDNLSEKKKARLEKKLDPRPSPVISAVNPAMNLGCTSDNFKEEVESYLKGDFKKSHLIKYGRKKLTEEEARDFLNILYQRALISPGEPVGVLAATSIGEQTTQMTLNTFHFAGQNAMNVTLGVPRLREILMTASKKIKTPQITVPLKRIDPALEAKVAKLVGKFRKVPLTEVLGDVHIKELLVRRDGMSFLKYKARISLCDQSVYGDEYSITPQEVLLYLENHFFRRFIDQVKKTLKNSDKAENVIRLKHEKEFVPAARRGGEDGDDDEAAERKTLKKDDDDEFSDDSDFEQEAKFEDEEEDEASDSNDEGEQNKDKVTDAANGEGDQDDDDDSDGDDNNNKDTRRRKIKTKDGKIVFVNEEQTSQAAKRAKLEIDDARVKDLMSRINCIKSYEYDTVDNLWCILEFSVSGKRVTHDLLKREIEKAFISQVPGLTNCIMKTIDKDDSPMYMFESAERLRIESGLGPETRRKKIVIEGKNILELLKYEELLSLDEMYCNDVHLVAETFSINVAKKIIIEEIRQVFKAYNIDIDFRHLYLIADYMSFQGIVMPFNRYGISSSTSVIQKASFETAMNFMKNAALTASYDSLECPSSSIAIGKLISTGTGSFELRAPLN